MIFFLLPSVNICIYKCIDCILDDEAPKSIISNSLSHYLYEIKNKIKLCENDWDIYKKYTNPYEYINSLVPDVFNKSNNFNLYSGLGCPRASNQERDMPHSGLMPRIEVNPYSCRGASAPNSVGDLRSPEEFGDFNAITTAQWLCNKSRRELQALHFVNGTNVYRTGSSTTPYKGIHSETNDHHETKVSNPRTEVNLYSGQRSKASQQLNQENALRHCEKDDFGEFKAAGLATQRSADLNSRIDARDTEGISESIGLGCTDCVAASLRSDQDRDMPHSGLRPRTEVNLYSLVPETNVIRYNKHLSRCVSKYKPLSRSYFKMIELLNNFIFTNNINLYRSFENQTYNYDTPNSAAGGVNAPRPIRSFHLAEGPGGFIEALVNMRKNSEDIYVGMTIVDDENEQNVPGWKKSEQFLKNNKNVSIELGEDGTGNILSMKNFLYCRNKYGSSMDLITADGGFDFSMDFNSQEQNISKLLFAQICYALCLQKMKGNFILKIFDCFIEHTVDLLYILSAFYEKVYITKPQTSRYANSEKYIVCKNFLVTNDKGVFPYLKTSFEKMLHASAINPDINIQRFLKIPISTFYITKMEEYNAIFGQQQIENIHQTITLIENKQKNDKLEAIIKSNIQKCIHWCVKYKIPYNTF
jgi:23S rRNA U2552 (ribose-2'-O)-methylase RlmE/FtsJ